MSTIKLAALVSAIYLLFLLMFNLVADIPVSWWLAIVCLTLVSFAIYVGLQKWHRQRRNSLGELTDHIRFERWYWQQLERDWIGRQVRLKEDIRNSNEPEALQVYVQAGSVGEIVALNRDEHAPFHVLFPEFAYKVAVRLEKLDLNAVDNLVEEYNAA